VVSSMNSTGPEPTAGVVAMMPSFCQTKRAG